MKEKLLFEAPVIIKKFLGYIQTVKGKSEKTVEEYYLDLRTFLRYIKLHSGQVTSDTKFSEINISDVDIALIKTVTLIDVFEYMNYLMEKRQNGAAARSRKVASLRAFFKYLTNKTGELEVNPMKELDTPKRGKTLPKFLTLEQSIALLNAAEVHGGKFRARDYCILTLFLNCGLRLSELAGINLNDMGTNAALKIKGKGNKERIVYLNEACRAAIENYKKHRPNEGVKDKSALFISRQNNRLSVKTVQLLVQKYLSLAGLGGLGYSTHKLRHTAATLMYQHGNVDIRILKDILGHENLGTTEIYTHLSNKQVKEAISANPLSKIQSNK